MTTENSGFRENCRTRNEAIIALAMRGKPPIEISDLFPEVSYERIKAIICEARDAGRPVPRFARGGTRPEPARPPAALPALTSDERRRIADLRSRRVPLTQIAALLRKPYALVMEA